MIKATDEHMLQLLAASLHTRQPNPVPAEEWPAVFDGLYAQAVYALPSEYAFSLGIPEDQVGGYLTAIAKNRRVFHNLMKIQDRIKSALDEASVPFVVLKGAAAAMNYPHPEDRSMGDIDLLVAPENLKKAYETLMQADGFKSSETPENYERHISFSVDKQFFVELHARFADYDQPEESKILDQALCRAISSRTEETVCGHPVPVLPPQENGLVLLYHIRHHLADGLGLRQIIDWMLFVEHYLDDDLWDNGFALMAEKTGMKQLAVLTTGMCQKYLGLHKEIRWSDCSPVCDDFMTYILDSGNFGKKPKTVKGRTVEVLKSFKNPLKGLSMAQQYGLTNWKAAKKHPVLRPFAWCYQLGHWTRAALKGGADAKVLADASVTAQKENHLLSKLGITKN